MSESTASTVTFTIHSATGLLLATAAAVEEAAAIWEAHAPDYPIVLGPDGLPAEIDPMAGPPPARPIHQRWRKRAEQQLRTRSGRLALRLAVAPGAVCYHVRQKGESYKAWHWVHRSEHKFSATPPRLDIDLLKTKDAEVAHA